MKIFLNSRITLFFLLLLQTPVLAGFSVFPEHNYPTDYFSSPVHFPISLAGNYGECRPNHFHSGLDIRTKQVENKPIYTIAPGYVSRISISHKGFGNALYINHKEGYTSLYAHLNTYNERIQKVVEMLQYHNQTWDIDIYLPFWMLLVEADEQVALSGNTGSSMAPHLHFEIRDSKSESTLNPWLFGFKIPDTVAPSMSALSIYSLDDDRLFYDQEPKYISSLGNGPQYSILNTIEFPAEKVGFGLMSQDYMNDKTGKLGVFETQVYVDGELHFAWQLNDIHYDDTRYLHSFTDYPLYKKKNKWYHYLFRLPGNHLSIFKDPKKTNGYIKLQKNKVHTILIKQFDVKGNMSTLSFKIKKAENYNDTSQSCSGTLVNPNVNNRLKHEGLEAIFSPVDFYTRMCLTITQDGDVYSLGSMKYPVHSYYKLLLDPSSDIKNKNYILERLSETDTVLEAKPCYAEGEHLICDLYRDLGRFRLAQDDTPPSLITHINKNLKQGSLLRIDCDDNATYVKVLRVKANGQWLCFKRRKIVYTYKIDNYCPKGDVDIEIYAEDASGNSLTKNIKTSIQ